MENIIQDYFFLSIDNTNTPERFIRLSGLDFNLQEDDGVDRKKTENSKIPLTLKENQEPLLTLFYYNDTNRDFLDIWRTVGVSGITNSLDKIVDGIPVQFRLGAVNLDWDKKLRMDFSNINIYNPFSWCKIQENDRDPFIIFYYKGLPQYYYTGDIFSREIIRILGNWDSSKATEAQLRSTRFKKLGYNFAPKPEEYIVVSDKTYYDNTGNSYQVKKGNVVNILPELGGEKKVELSPGTSFILQDPEDVIPYFKKPETLESSQEMIQLDSEWVNTLTPLEKDNFRRLFESVGDKGNLFS